MIETIAIAVVAAIMYAGSMYLKKLASSENPQDFDVAKFVSTLIVAVVIAATMIGAGITTITEADIATQLVMYAGLTTLIENTIKTIYRKIVPA